MNRYQITVMDNQTGEMLKAPIECEGFSVIAFRGRKSEGGIYERLRWWMKGSSIENLACALYSEPNLRRAARMCVFRGCWWELREMLRPKRRRNEA